MVSFGGKILECDFQWFNTLLQKRLVYFLLLFFYLACDFVFQIADEHKAVLLADMAHISGLVAAQVFQMCFLMLTLL